ncbi:hypothetical protein AVEN_65354-1 [Araneus ventricosus]|uniref:Uncharacterized protein n=1 Tax=Araneus ventricosus TaxID=182803 RepID=A0A4Y2H7V0_ARAVE|nr:hypothetical protein AVEN_65354-1 [Araneus ventricosus]
MAPVHTFIRALPRDFHAPWERRDCSEFHRPQVAFERLEVCQVKRLFRIPPTTSTPSSDSWFSKPRAVSTDHKYALERLEVCQVTRRGNGATVRNSTDHKYTLERLEVCQVTRLFEIPPTTSTPLSDSWFSKPRAVSTDHKYALERLEVCQVTRRGNGATVRNSTDHKYALERLVVFQATCRVHRSQVRPRATRGSELKIDCKITSFINAKQVKLIKRSSTWKPTASNHSACNQQGHRQLPHLYACQILPVTGNACRVRCETKVVLGNQTQHGSGQIIPECCFIIILITIVSR